MLESITSIQQVYQLDPDLEHDVTHLREWLNKQLHLPQQVTDAQMVAFLVSNNRSLELTKLAIDSHFTIKCGCPEFFSQRDPLGEDIKHISRIIQVIPLKTRSPEGYMYVMNRTTNHDPSEYVPDAAIKLVFMMIDSALKDDVRTSGIILVSDTLGFSIVHATKSSLYFKKYILYVQEGMSVRIKTIHLINTNPLVDTITNRMKSFIKKENVDLINFHSEGTDLESLYKYVPRKILPKEYGGEAGTCDELYESCLSEMLMNREWFKSEEENCKVDESKREGGTSYTAELLGLQGSFKKLEVD